MAVRILDDFGYDVAYTKDRWLRDYVVQVDLEVYTFDDDGLSRQVRTLESGMSIGAIEYELEEGEYVSITAADDPDAIDRASAILHSLKGKFIDATEISIEG